MSSYQLSGCQQGSYRRPAFAFFLFLLLIAVAVPRIVFAQTISYPKLPKSGSTVEQFIPAGWSLLDSASGDLNKDKIVDIALVLQSDPIKSSEQEADDDDYVPEERVRLLAVLFGEKKGGYTLSVQADSAVLGSLDGGVFGDPWSGISANDGTLRFSFYGGSSWRWGMEYQFRYQKKEWRLIGATTLSYNSVSGEMEEYDFNLLTGDVGIVTGNMFGVECIDCEDESNCETCEECGEGRTCTEVEDSIVRKNIGKKTLRNLESFTPMSWEIMPEVYI